MRVAVGLARCLEVVRFAEDPAILDRRRSALPPWHHVVDLQPRGRAADSSIREFPLALPLVPPHDLPLHLGRHAGRPLPLLLDEQLQRRREDLLVARSGIPVGVPCLRLLQQRQELPRDRDVEPARRGGHGYDQRSFDSGPFLLRSGHVAFAWANFRNRLFRLLDRFHRPRRLHPGHHGPRRHQRPGLQLRGQFQGLLLGEAVEPREHRGQVLLRRNRGQHRRGGEAELPFPYRLQYFRESLDEPGAGAPVMSRRAGELQTLVEIGEQVRVAEVAEELAPVELGQGLEEGAQGGELDAEEVDESGVEGASGGEIGVVHERQCLTRFRGLVGRTRIPTAASIRREISNLARRGEVPCTGLLHNDRAIPAAAASRKANLTKPLSIGHSRHTPTGSEVRETDGR